MAKGSGRGGEGGKRGEVGRGKGEGGRGKGRREAFPYRRIGEQSVVQAKGFNPSRYVPVKQAFLNFLSLKKQNKTKLSHSEELNYIH